MRFKTRNGQLVLRALLIALSFFLSVGNTLRAINVSHSVEESISEAKKEASATQEDDATSLINSKYSEISQFDAGSGKEDIDHDYDSFLSGFQINIGDKKLSQRYLFPGTQEKDITHLPLFLLYCQSKAYLI